jgi:hypothetical protein
MPSWVTPPTLVLPALFFALFTERKLILAAFLWCLIFNNLEPQSVPPAASSILYGCLPIFAMRVPGRTPTVLRPHWIENQYWQSGDVKELTSTSTSSIGVLLGQVLTKFSLAMTFQTRQVIGCELWSRGKFRESAVWYCHISTWPGSFTVKPYVWAKQNLNISKLHSLFGEII